MPRVIVIEEAQKDFDRLELFLKSKNREAAKRLRRLVRDALARLKSSPYSGSPCGSFRRLILKFGQSAYIIHYYIDETLDEVYVVAAQHGREDLSHPEHAC